MSTRIDLSKLTLMDALDLAALIEIEASRRYALFVEQLGTRNSGDAGAVFASMVNYENKHCERLAQRRLALFGNAPPNVKLDDIFDVEAPDIAEPNWNTSPLKAYQIALAAERKAHAFYDQALGGITQPDVKTLFEELRKEEAEHARMLSDAIAKLPPSAAEDLEDLDDDPYKPAKYRAPY